MLIHPNITGGFPDHLFGGTHHAFGQGRLAAEAAIGGDVLAAGASCGASAGGSALVITTGLVLCLTGFHVAAGDVVTGDLSTLAPLALLALLGVLPALRGVALHSTGIGVTGMLIGLAASRVMTRIGIGRLVPLLMWVVRSVA